MEITDKTATPMTTTTQTKLVEGDRDAIPRTPREKKGRGWGVVGKASRRPF